MRNTLIALLTLILLGAGATYFYFSPRFAFDEIREAAKANDTEKLAERVDFPKLREGVKAQLNAQVAQKMSEELGDNPFAAFGAALATVAVDSLVDAYVSPAAIGALAAGLSPQHGKPKSRRRAEADPAPVPNADTNQSNATPAPPKAEKNFVQFDALDRASVHITGKHGEKLRFVLHLDGVRWRLVNIVLD